MRASKAFGAVFALGLGGAAVFALNHGLDTQVEIREPCKDSRLSYTDQNACRTEAQATNDKDAQNDVYARYIAKAEAVESVPKNVGPAPTRLVGPSGKPHVVTRQM
jgi:hypothetical protein